MESLKERIKKLKEMRNTWLVENLDQETIALCRKNGIKINLKRTGKNTEWGNWKWHLRNRLTDKQLDLFLSMFSEYKSQKKLLRKYLKSYDLSILPLNLLLPEGVKKFLPRLGFVPSPDPYGIQREYSVMCREEKGKKFYITTHKPNYASFLLLLGSSAKRIYCPIGCAGCYRGPQTRFREPLHLIHNNGGHEELWMPQPEEQVKWLVKKWNTDIKLSGVYDILFSGGEPMMLSNDVWRKILKHLESAKYLRSFRICTGSLFLGLPFRFDDDFIKSLVKFREKTGIQIKISAHLSHPEHITPEAVYFARKLIKAGIELLPQCPIEPEVNFWMNNLERTEKTLRKLDRLLALAVGTRCYKWILDMQGGISFLPTVEIWRRIHDRHQEESDIARPTSIALFLPYPEGNVNLSYHSLWAIKMRVDKKSKTVHYRIPHPSQKWLNYKEPLWKGVNDDPSYLEVLKI